MALMARGQRRASYDRHRDVRHQDSAQRVVVKEQERAAADTRDKQVTLVVSRYTSRRLSPPQMAPFREFLLPVFLGTDLSADAVKRVLPFFAVLLAPTIRQGQPLVMREVFDSRAVAHFLEVEGPKVSEHQASRIASAVRKIARTYRLSGYTGFERTHSRPKRLKGYPDDLAARQYTAASRLPVPWRREALTLLDLGYGAGARPKQARAVQGRDVRRDRGLVAVTLVGFHKDDPTVNRPVPGAPGERLLEAATLVGPDGFLVCDGRARSWAFEDVIEHMHAVEPSLGRFRIQRAADNWFARAIKVTPVMAVLTSMQLAPSSKTVTDILGGMEQVSALESFQMLTSVPPAPFADRDQ
ncbi:hypothetical protein AB6N24_17915 [Cellulomonas sp. 179-A 4D5 NHS]|uniref:hypothetical protein n=1 Tax=Cellulomonas sp. 179-A 4D5 NHS TaxID=3142378 RepID=UPI0039A10FF0